MSRKKESAKTMARRILRPGGYWMPEAQDAKIYQLRLKLRELARAVIREDRAARKAARKIIERGLSSKQTRKHGKKAED